MTTRRDFIKNAGMLIGSTALAGTIPSCSSFLPQIEQQRFAKINIEMIPFQGYSPKSENKKIVLDDLLLKEYIEKPIRIHEFHHYLFYGKYNKINPILINDKTEFKKEILKTADELKYSNLETLSIQDAIFASGKIVAHKMQYNKKMISEEEKILFKGDPNEVFLKLLYLSHNSKDIRNEEAKRIDELPIDKLFKEGNGVCRNYAKINAAVFNVIKESNRNLINTYMKEHGPESLQHAIALPHSWNIVFTLNKNENEVNILTTQVDPTWLDTRNKTKDNSGEKSLENEVELYNALDESHFGPNLLIAKANLAEIYENLGDQNRFYLDKISKEDYMFYKNKGFDQRIANLHDIIDNVNNESNYTIFHFKENFKYAVENLTHSLISIIFAYRNDLSESLRFEPYDKLLEKFKRLEKTYHMARKKIPNCLIDKDISYYATGEKTKHGEGLETVKVLNKFTSIEELFNKVKENFKG